MKTYFCPNHDNTGVMKIDVMLDGTNLKLHKGESVRVKLVRYSNKVSGFSESRYVNPLSGDWGDQGILVNLSDIGPLGMKEHWEKWIMDNPCEEWVETLDNNLPC